MSRIRFYFDHSLIGYFSRRAKEKWFSSPVPAEPPKPLAEDIEYHGVKIKIGCLPKEMQKVFEGDYYETSEINLLTKFVSAGDRVLEIGAALGFVGLYCRKVLKVDKLVSVEPNPRTIAYLKKNYELNGLEPVLICAALAEHDGPVQLQVSDMFWEDSLASKNDGTAGECISVEGLSFEGLVRRANFSFNTLVIDCEGAEQFIPFKTIPDGIEKVVIELHPQMIGARAAYKVLADLIRLGFDVQGQDNYVWALSRTVQRAG